MLERVLSSKVKGTTLHYPVVQETMKLVPLPL